jgi:Uma2 family endonuclease
MRDTTDSMAQPEAPYGRPMSVQEWCELPENVPGELVDGRLVEEEMTDSRHELIVGWLIAALRAWLVDRGGFVLSSNAKFRLGERHGRKPDVTAYFPGRKPPARGAVAIPPDIAIEIISPRPRDVRRDRVDKLREYAAFGVGCYWLLDPEARSLEVLELDSDGRYRHALGAAEGAVEIPGCRGLRLDLDALWRELDMLEAGP